MSKTVPFSMRLDPEFKAELQRLADADRRSLTNYIEVVLAEHVAFKKHMERAREIVEASGIDKASEIRK